MLKVLITGKLNLNKVKNFLDRRFESVLRELPGFFPELKTALDKKFLKIEIDPKVKCSNKTVVISETNSFQDVSEILKRSVNFYDEVSLKTEEIGQAEQKVSNQKSEFELSIGDDFLSKSLAELQLSVRVTNCLGGEGIDKVGDLIKKSAEDLLEICNFGPLCLEEVRTKLLSFSLKLKDD
ncbi:MAG: hypothetical protein A3C58_01160 [Candidatus Staskawiczbacteria bacterium RIFCSPHIGHO2_02_FULL_34_10]|uniref:RNA polymerase alpha subunit C-terminal domain-containing protein n=1 Tax=Candidatus Staskawiczbacteria bacterium RIFCSPHIGHO2_02_FULL_34_10 TaxID=1802205 RepID=A0A1G2HWA3_9BACT|nr:MAG: hypothetical protein A3C58_01160 [Candidatus Staskawiczbacteria bacterium RIFCSPHIGHO2_02_FULL_34_10]